MLQPQIIRKGYAQTELGQIHYLETARTNTSGAALPALVLLHQTPSSGEMFRPLMQLLAQDFYCIAPDFIGFGNSDEAPDDHSVALYAQSVWLCLQALQVSAPLVFGHHTGVAVAAQLEHDHPGFCRKLMFSGPTLLSDTQKLALPDSVVDASTDEAGEFLQRYWQKIRGKDTAVPIELSLRETLLALRLGTSYKKAYQAVAAQDFARQIAHIQCPTLVFAGERDVLRALVAPTVALLPKGQKADIGDASTYVCETHSAQLAQLITDFCSQHNSNSH